MDYGNQRILGSENKALGVFFPDNSRIKTKIICLESYTIEKTRDGYAKFIFDELFDDQDDRQNTFLFFNFQGHDDENHEEVAVFSTEMLREFENRYSKLILNYNKFNYSNQINILDTKIQIM